MTSKQINCIFPLLLPETCTHTDYRCICTNLRSLDDPPLPPQNDTDRGETISPSPYTSPFATCVNETCGLLEQIRAPGHILNLCWTFGVPVDFPEVMVPFYLRSGLYARATPGSAFSGRFSTQPPAVSTLNIGPGSVVDSSTPIPTSLPAATTSNAPTTGTGSRTSSGSTSAVNTFNSFQTSATSTGATPPTITGSNDNKKSDGLSSGAKIGIGVSIPLVVILLLAGAFWYFRARRTMKTTPEISDNIDTIPEKYSESKQLAEVGGVQINEMGHTSSGTSANVYEMPSQTMGHASPPSSSTSMSRIPISPRAELAGDKSSNPSIVPSPGNKTGDLNDASLSSLHFQPFGSAPQITSASSSNLPQQQTGAVTDTDGGAEIVRLEREMAEVQRKKERLQEEKALERREEELRRIIDERKKVMGGSRDLGAGTT